MFDILQPDAPTNRSGKKVHIKPKDSTWDFLKHVPDLPSSQPERANPKPSLESTKFLKGFRRRGNHWNATREQERQRADERAVRKCERETKLRQERWSEQRSKGFDIVTGKEYKEFSGKRPVTSEGGTNLRRGRKFFTTLYSASTIREAEGQMRASRNRFFTKPHEGPQAQRRHDALKHDGLDPTSRKSAVIGYVRGQLKSHGAADNFGASHWQETASANKRQNQGKLSGRM
jgi:hypothetical protein